MFNLLKKIIIIIILLIIAIIIVTIIWTNRSPSLRTNITSKANNVEVQTNTEELLEQDTAVNTTIDYNKSKEEENILLKNLIVTNQLWHKVIMKFIFDLDYTEEVNELKDMKVSEDKIEDKLDKLKLYYNRFLALPEYEQVFPDKNSIISKIIKIEKQNKSKAEFKKSAISRELMYEPELRK